MAMPLFDIQPSPDPGLARRADPDTAKAAARSVDANALEALVLTALRHGPQTSHEIADRLHLSLVSISPRMKPLETKRKVVRAGKREGRTVWRAV